MSHLNPNSVLGDYAFIPDRYEGDKLNAYLESIQYIINRMSETGFTDMCEPPKELRLWLERFKKLSKEAQTFSTHPVLSDNSATISNLLRTFSER